MNNPLRILIIFIIFTVIFNPVFSQDDLITDRKLLIKIRQPGEKEMKEMKLEGKEAIQFDVEQFISQNQNAIIEIGGRQIKDREVVKYTFNSRELSAVNYIPKSCTSFCPKEISSQPIALLGVATKREDNSEGIKITRIVPGSAAEEAGLEVGDVIMFINEMDVLSGCDLKAAINLLPVGSVVKVDFLRKGTYKSLYTTLGYKIQRIMSWEPCCDQPANLAKRVKTKKHASHPSLRVYPNPGSGLFNIQFQSTKNQPVSFYVTDATGKQIYSQIVSDFHTPSRTNLNLTSMSAGIYFLHIRQADWVGVEKLIIQKP